MIENMFIIIIYFYSIEFCVIPSIPNAEVVIKSNGNGTISDELVRNFTQIAIYCNKGYTLSGDETATCMSGQWNITKVQCNRDNEDATLRSCSVPAIQNGYYEKPDDPNYIKGNPILSGDSISVTCKENYTLSIRYNTLTCNNGKFYEIPTCNANCAPIKFHVTVVEYTKYGIYLESDSLPDGTIALVKCPKHYTGHTDKITITTCRDGFWNRFYIRCFQECGDLVPEGTATGKRKFPWHVAIYRQIPKKPLNLICSGSLISAKFVLTAEYCFPEEAKLKFSEFSIAAGKYYSDWNAPEDADFVQKRKVRSFDGIPVEGMAIVIVDTPFTLTDLVKPVCINTRIFNIEEESNNGSKAQVVGWGAAPTKILTHSVALQQFTVTLINREQCLKMLQDNFQEFNPFYGFCVGYANESSACNEDMGTGIFFPQEINGKKKYYIQGIKSVNKNSSCYKHEIGLYTNVRLYEYTITRLLNEKEDLYCC